LNDSQDRDQRTLLDRLLGIFTEVRAGEGGLALAMAFLVFLLLTAYYLIKPAREALILQEGGAEAKSYMSAVMAVLLFFLVQGYAKLVSRFERTRLITVVTSIFMACLIGFWALSRSGVPYLGYVFFVWVGIFSVMVVAQFWSYANDVYSNEAGKRLFPLVGFGAVVGSFAGADVAKRLVEYVSIFELLLLAAGILGVCIAITNLISIRVWGRQQIRVSQSSLQDCSISSIRQASTSSDAWRKKIVRRSSSWRSPRLARPEQICTSVTGISATLSRWTPKQTL
jgi:ATP/ADP translocase